MKRPFLWRWRVRPVFLIPAMFFDANGSPFAVVASEIGTEIGLRVSGWIGGVLLQIVAGIAYSERAPVRPWPRVRLRRPAAGMQELRVSFLGLFLDIERTNFRRVTP